MSLEPFTSQDTDEWATPPELLRPLHDAVGGFDLDPCSGAEERTLAAEAYTAADDGLAQPWHGDVWLNPPYSAVEEWLEKTVHESLSGRVNSVLALVKGDTSTDWYQQYGFQADAIGMIGERLEFGEAGNTAPFASHVLVYGDVPPAVFDVLGQWGTVVRVDTVARTEQTDLTEIA